ncbi:hypothetical protein CTAYLR_007880 [Chrysophaeum taylorii]|uniref:Xaa-Pro dipeptidyl-peptidase-like domain-containing protein n=1 Tax=Chrysophaeum taylorii TaxID=2483200 RepID=A0AAD7XQS0_9STRA|nr:hypothetical protein CTAYLR_007880 [Chrysophaeum taylorii]
MPGLPLTSEWAPEVAPKLYYCSLGVPVESLSKKRPTVVEVSDAGCNSAMSQAARQAAAFAEPSWKFHTSMRWSGEARWRVCTSRSEAAVVALVADWRYGDAQARAFAERVEQICSPMLAEMCASAEYGSTAEAMLRREMHNANERRLGMMEPIGSAASCALCGATLASILSLPSPSPRLATPVNCASCGDVVCQECAKPEGESGGSTRCLDCEHARIAGRRHLRLQPPGGSEIAKRFALRALFDERASNDVVDERAFVDLCKAASRHPLVVDRRSLEREIRRLGPGASSTKLPLDYFELQERFRETERDALDFDAARDLLVATCVPPWPARALERTDAPFDDDAPGEPSHDEEPAVDAISDDDDYDDDDDDNESLEDPRGARSPEQPRRRRDESSWWWNPGGSLAAAATGVNARTGWGSLASVDGLARRRVWLELRDAAPRSLQYARDAAEATRVLAYLSTVRQIRRDAPCVLEFRLEPSARSDGLLRGGYPASSSRTVASAAKRPNNGRGESIFLRFETPAATSSWWSALCAARRAARNEGTRRNLERVDRVDYYDRVGVSSVTWINALSRFFVCGIDCGVNGVVCAPAVGPFEGPERPFVTLTAEAANGSSSGIQRSASARAERERLVKKFRGVVADRRVSATANGGPPRRSASDNKLAADASKPLLLRRGGSEGAAPAKVLETFDSDESDSDDDATRLELGDSLPERGFALAGPEVKAAFQALVKVIIRPPRATFDEKRLGARDFAIRPPRGLSVVDAKQQRQSAGSAAASSSSKATSTFWATPPRSASSSSPATPVVVHRDDFAVPNERGLEVRYSLWTPKLANEPPTSKSGDDDRPPCVVYVHGNACSRLGSLSLLRPLALGGLSLCAVDCAGSGNSGGEFVSLGHFERDDVAAVVDDLRRRKLVSRVALWGRSMGASTALLYASTRDPHASAVVADSPYSSLVDLCRELVAKARRRGGRNNNNSAGNTTSTSGARSNDDDAKFDDGDDGGGGPSAGARELVLSAITEAALSLVRSSVKHRAGFDVYDVSPIAHVANMRHSATPVLFVHGARDDFVSPSHSKALHDAHGGDASLLLVPCDHQATRPASAMVHACLFVYDRLVPRSSDRTKYAQLLQALADDGYLGTRDRPRHQNADTPQAPEDHASGLDRSRQARVEHAVLNNLETIRLKKPAR